MSAVGSSAHMPAALGSQHASADRPLAGVYVEQSRQECRTERSARKESRGASRRGFGTLIVTGSQYLLRRSAVIPGTRGAHRAVETGKLFYAGHGRLQAIPQ